MNALVAISGGMLWALFWQLLVHAMLPADASIFLRAFFLLGGSIAGGVLIGYLVGRYMD